MIKTGKPHTAIKAGIRWKTGTMIERKLSGRIGAPCPSVRPPLRCEVTIRPESAEARRRAAPRRAWTPILAGKQARQAADVIKSVAEELHRIASHESSANGTCASDGRGMMNSSLAGGSAGLAVFYACLAEAKLAANASQCALAFLSHAVDRLAADPREPSLFGGYTGTAWAVAHLEGRLFKAGNGDPNEAIDEALRRLLRRSPWRGDIGLGGGLVGFGVYALERLPRPSGIELLELVVARLEERAEIDTVGVTWRNDGHSNLGLADGIPGVIALLSRVCARHEEEPGNARRRSRDLLDRAVAWLLAQEPANHSTPDPAGAGIQARPARLAWCSGELGIAAALLQAARATQNAGWEREALKIAHRAARCSAKQAGVVDCGLNRGAAGVAHLFNRQYQATGDHALKEAAQLWFARTLEMRQAGKGIGGFPRYTPDPETPDAKRWTNESGIVDGAAGVALALLGAITDIEPTWDRIMLAPSADKNLALDCRR